MQMPIEDGRVIYANWIATAHRHASRGRSVNSIGIMEVEGAPRNAVKASIGTLLGSVREEVGGFEAGSRVLSDHNRIFQEQ